MKTTRTLLLASLLSALIYAVGQALAGVPNVELVTALSFISGYLLGVGWGALVGAAGMGVHSLFNVMGTVAPPVWLAQVGCFAVIGCAGGLIGPAIAGPRTRVHAALLSAITGAVLVLVYQLVVNLTAFYTFTNDVPVWTYVWGGMVFGAVQVGWNAVVFGIAIPPMLRVLARYRRELIAIALVTVGLYPFSAHAQTARAVSDDSVAVRSLDFERIGRERYLRRHAFSLDHFLEFEPGGFVTRLGPIGNDAFYSRWGIGRGRALLTMNGVPLNNPQDDSPPLLHTPTSGLGTLSLSTTTGVPWIEGILELDEMTPPSGRPHTFVELSKGTNDVRQRRVRFSSEESEVGIDLAYDEVLDDGYAFDASGTVPNITDYGSARSRQSTIVLRGDPDRAARFAMGVRGYTSTTQGDLTSNTSEGRESGHVLWLDAGVDRSKLTLFARGYKSSVPDSTSENETLGALGTWSLAGTHALTLRARVESIDGTQDVDSAHTRERIVRATGDVGASRCAGDATLTASATVASDDETPLAWGAGVGAGWDIARSRIGVTAARSFRLPNLSERYLPAHVRGGTTRVGDADLEPETAWEFAGYWNLVLGSFVNRARASWVEAQDAIAFRPRAVGGETWSVASNAPGEGTMWFLEDRVHAEWDALSLRFLADAAGLYTTGDRVDAFQSVPKAQVNASILFGRSFFEASSALYVGAQFLAVDERRDYSGVSLPDFQVLNLLLEGRLLDARLYLQYLNVLDEQYQTQGNYLMTPQTFVYGIEWTLFN